MKGAMIKKIEMKNKLNIENIIIFQIYFIYLIHPRADPGRRPGLGIAEL